MSGNKGVSLCGMAPCGPVVGWGDVVWHREALWSGGEMWVGCGPVVGWGGVGWVGRCGSGGEMWVGCSTVVGWGDVVWHREALWSGGEMWVGCGPVVGWGGVGWVGRCGSGGEVWVGEITLSTACYGEDSYLHNAFFRKMYLHKCDLLSKKRTRPAKIEFEFEAILFILIVFQPTSDYYTNVYIFLCTCA